MDLKTAIGFDPEGRKPVLQDPFLVEYVNLQLAAHGLPSFEGKPFPFMELARPLLEDYKHKTRLLKDYLNPVDKRIQDFLDKHLRDTGEDVPQIPRQTMVLDRHGVGRVLSLPADGDKFESDIIKSYRVRQGVLHNPKSDKRTTEGSFHIAEGGFPIPNDKIAVPKKTYLRMLDLALRPPDELTLLPFTSSQENKAHAWVSLLLRPTVCPEVPGWIKEKSLEIRFFAPGSLVSNLDFVESIFGNAGDPALPENDAALDTDHWSGHSGCVILAPHLVSAKKKEMGLPHVDDATERQKRDGMCWESEDELYNDGNAFKLTIRDTQGVMVTLLSDNYFGYCKKEVKTQISFAANLHGLVEEEHAGGAIAFPSYDLGDDFVVTSLLRDYMKADHSFSETVERYGSLMDLQAEGYGIDRNYPDVYYVPEDAHFSLLNQSISWVKEGEARSIRVKPDATYILPSGYKVEMARPSAKGRQWRFIGRAAEGTF